ncbi:MULTISPECIES: EsaB/YukD family protein [Clostridiaceae]|uniref:EsaB/YukD family protein n=1 Tax=Clostridiaceae TaxID=31979 RepID=UPI00055277EB|nr:MULTISPECIES: EsaB/YukD family protein [Clostridiaceae]
MNKAIVILNIPKLNKKVDIEVPLDITANDLVIAINKAYDLKINTDNIMEVYARSEKPIALLKGNKTLEEFNIRDGSIINILE